LRSVFEGASDALETLEVRKLRREKPIAQLRLYGEDRRELRRCAVSEAGDPARRRAELLGTTEPVADALLAPLAAPGNFCA